MSYSQALRGHERLRMFDKAALHKFKLCSANRTMWYRAWVRKAAEAASSKPSSPGTRLRMFKRRQQAKERKRNVRCRAETTATEQSGPAPR